MIQYEELRENASELFCHLVDTPSKKQKTKVSTDKSGRKTEKTTFYVGSKIIGMQTRTACGYRYYVRQESPLYP